MKTIITIRLVCDESVFEESSPQNEYDDILTKPFLDAGYELNRIEDHDKTAKFTFEIKKVK